LAGGGVDAGVGVRTSSCFLMVLEREVRDVFGGAAPLTIWSSLDSDMLYGSMYIARDEALAGGVGGSKWRLSRDHGVFSEWMRL